jgi:hypothetical protein
MVGSKQIGFQQLETAQKVFGGNATGSEQLNEMLTQKGGVETNRALGLASSMTGETQKKFLLDFGLADPAKAKLLNDAMELAQKTIGPFGGDDVMKKAIIDFNVLNADKLVAAKQNIDSLSGLSGKKITLAVTTGSVFDKGVQDAIKRDIKRFNKYNDAGKITYTTELQQIMIMKKSGDKALLAAFEVWKSEGGNKNKTFADYASYQADRTVRDASIDNTKGPGSEQEQKKEAKAPDPSILDPYVKMLREANNYQQKLTTGWDASFKAIMKYTSASIKQMGGFAVMMQQSGAAAEEIQAFMNGTEEEQNRIVDKKTGKLKKNAADLLKKLKEIREASEIGLKYVLMSPAERLAKDNELYQAGLDVISIKEKKINDKYNDRVKALDEIGKIQEKNNQQQQDTMTLADALSKGDIAAAAKAALQAKQNDQKAALESARTSIENARKIELEGIEIRINGVLTRRTELEAKLETNAKNIADYKLLEAERVSNIEQNALKSAKHMADMLRDGKALSLLKPYNPGTPGGTPTTKAKTDTDTTSKSVSQVASGLKNIGSMGSFGGQAMGQSIADIASGKEKTKAIQAAKVTRGKAAIGFATLAAKAGVTGTNIIKNSGFISDAQRAALAKGRSKLTATERDEVDAFLESYDKGVADLAIAEAMTTESMAATKLGTLPQPVQDAFNKLAEFKAEYEPLIKARDAANTAISDFKTSAGTDMTKWGKADKAKNKELLAQKQAAQTALSTFETKNINPIWVPLQKAGYGMGARKLFSGFAKGGMVYANNGLSVEASKYALGTDTIPAMLTAGEFVMSKPAVDRIGKESLSSMNNGTSAGESVYNYSITVNANSSDSSGIADAVLREIQRIDSRRIRSSAI